MKERKSMIGGLYVKILRTPPSFTTSSMFLRFSIGSERDGRQKDVRMRREYLLCLLFLSSFLLPPTSFFLLLPDSSTHRAAMTDTAFSCRFSSRCFSRDRSSGIFAPRSFSVVTKKISYSKHMFSIR